MRIALLAIALLVGGMASTEADAYRGRARVYFHFGGPWYPYWYYPGPYYYYSSPVIVHHEEPVYVERDEPASDQGSASWWYYCEESKIYYPYVKTCPGGWKKVRPTPPPAGQ